MASQSRTAFASIVSKTEVSWPGELEIALRNLSGRGLLLQQLTQLIKQPRVFNRDHGLVGKGPKKCNLLIRKRLNFGTSKLNCSDRHSVA